MLSLGLPVTVNQREYRISALWEHGAVLTLASVTGEPTRPDHITTKSRAEVSELIAANVHRG